MKQDITIFHLQRKAGKPLLLHPFDDYSRLLHLDKDTRICGRFGSEPRPETITLLRNDLYRKVELAVKSWITEKRFIPRFLLSSALFLFLYFFFSLAVRDPLPMIDEIAISFALALLLYLYLSRRDTGSREAAEKRIMLREKIDAIYFDYDPLVEEAEKLLIDLESREAEALTAFFNKENEGLIVYQHEIEEELVEYLKKRFSGRAYRKQEKLLRKERKKAVLNQNLDLPLYGVYRSMKKQSIPE